MLPSGITYIVHPASRAQLERDAANAKAATRRRRREAAGKGAPAPAPRVVVVPPTAMTGDKQVVDVGGIEAQVLFLGRAHTGGDLMVYLPAAEDPVHERGLSQSRVSGDALRVSL